MNHQVDEPPSRPMGRAVVPNHSVLSPHEQVLPLPESAGDLREQEGVPEDDMRNGQVISVFSAKGGCGKSVVAVNLAIALAAGGRNRVCLIDLDLTFGDLAIMLQLNPARTIADAIDVADRIDETGLRTLLTPYGDGVQVLLAPVKPAQAEQISRDLVADLLHFARADFDYVVVDTPSSFNDQTLAALDASHHYLLVTTPELPALKSLRVTLDTFELLDYRREARHVILNRCDAKVGMTVADVERVTRTPLACQIPSSREVPTSVNRAVPLIVTAPNHPVSTAIAALASRFTGTEGAKARRGLFARRKG